MNVLDWIKKLLGASMLLSFLSFTASPAISFLGITEPAVVESPEYIRYILVVGIAAIMFLIVCSLGLGYLILTGWVGYRSFSRAFKLVFSFALGLIAFMLSGPLSILITFPILPTLLVSFAIWLSFRVLSLSLISRGTDEVRLAEALSTAQNLVRELDSRVENTELLESGKDGYGWRVVLRAIPMGNRYEVKIDGGVGGVSSWRVL